MLCCQFSVYIILMLHFIDGMSRRIVLPTSLLEIAMVRLTVKWPHTRCYLTITNKSGGKDNYGSILGFGSDEWCYFGQINWI